MPKVEEGGILCSANVSFFCFNIFSGLALYFPVKQYLKLPTDEEDSGLCRLMILIVLNLWKWLHF